MIMTGNERKAEICKGCKWYRHGLSPYDEAPEWLCGVVFDTVWREMSGGSGRDVWMQMCTIPEYKSNVPEECPYILEQVV
jgi:hypothetical protein